MRDLSSCAEECFKCIRNYKKKHSLIQGQSFDIKCGGIPSEYVPLNILKDLPEEERLVAQAMVDPVAWAAQTLDWHCLDLDGEIWKRKNPEEYYSWLQKNPTKSIEGNSRYHRPYQAEMLRCQALRKVFRIGRQCLASSARVHLKNGTTKSIRDIKVGDQVLSLKEETNTQTYSKVIDHWSSGIKKIYKVRTKFGHEIECSDNHPFLAINNKKQDWKSINDGLSVESRIAVLIESIESIEDPYVMGDVLWDHVSSIEELGEEETWDIEVEGTHNFVANGMYTHNSGKCLISGTLIQMSDGSLKKIEDIDDGDMVLSSNENYRIKSTPAFRACNGIKPVAKLELMDGRSIEATYNHPFFTRTNQGRKKDGNKKAVYLDEWKPLEEITENDYIAVPINLPTHSNKKIDNRYLSLIGFLIADGNLTSGNCRFSNQDIEVLDKMRETLKFFDCSLKHYDCDARCDYHIIGQGAGKKHGVKGWLKSVGIYGLNGHQKYIPDEYMDLCRENTVELISSLFSCDGWVSIDKNNKVEIGYSTVSERLADQVVALLARFGVYTTKSVKTVKLDGKKFLSRQLAVTRKSSIENFYKNIGIFSKREKLEEAYRVSQLKNVAYKTEAYEENDLCFIRVRSIVPAGEKMTWDLSVPETKNFIANNILSHNTECLVISMLYAMFTKPAIPKTEGFEIILITPYQAQIDLIFTRMMQLIRSSSITQNSLKRHVKAPMYSIQLHNDSKVTGFTAGTKSGGNADAVRGQHGHMLVFDEADYLSSADVDSALSIITNYPNATVWMSSTPSGRRERFFQTCGSKIFKEYHYTSQVNPMWNKDLEALFREQLTEIGYKHEILAEFGEQEQGVFQNSYIQAAKADYTYGQMPPDSSWTYTMGVDWNDVKNGTTICMLGFNPKEKLFYIVDRHVVSREGWTQLSACNKIAELNRFWKPIVIYIDSGFGGTQYEVLRKHGYDSLADPTKGPTHPDSRLRDIVKKYDFGSKVDVHDLFTKRIVSKPAKPFLVQNAVRRFESNDLRFPENDDRLEAQLQGYIVDRITANGTPVYKAGDESAGDHSLDALMLSIVGFTLEVTPLGKPKYDTGINFSGRFGESVDPLIHEGDTVIHPGNRKQKNKDNRNNKKPTTGRDSVVNQNKNLLSSPNDLPASNTNKGQDNVGLWSWPGFGSDSPKPRVRSLAEAEGDAGRRIGLKRRLSGKPSRKNI